MESLKLESTIKSLYTLLAKNLEQMRAYGSGGSKNHKKLKELIEEQVILQELIVSALHFYVGNNPELLSALERGIFEIQLVRLLGVNQIRMRTSEDSN